MGLSIKILCFNMWQKKYNNNKEKGKMYIDKYTINSYGSKWKGNKELKNKLLTSVKSEDGQRLRKMVAFLEEYEDLNHQYSSDIELIINIKRND